MKNILVLATAFVATMLPVPALTGDDLTASALAGKTVTFTIESGTAPLATTGGWTGKFETSPAEGFTIRNVSGNTVNISTTAVYDGEFAGLHSYFIDPILSSGERKTAVLTLWISNGAGRYELLLRPLVPFQDPEIRQFGGFTIGGGATKAPEIVVQQPAGSNLTDDKAKRSFGTMAIGKSSNAKTFVIANTGKAKLTGLAIARKGANKGDFTVTPLDKTSLAPGATMKFKVTFKPKAAGTRTAAIAISSNDANENPFNIKLSGEGAK